MNAHNEQPVSFVLFSCRSHGSATLPADATHRRVATIYSFVLFGPCCVLGYVIGLRLHCPDALLVPCVVAFGACMASVGQRAMLVLGSWTGEAIGQFVLPSGSTTPYRPAFSYQDSLAARGDLAGALASYEAILHRSPTNAAAYARAAELYMELGDYVHAADLFRRLRAIPGIPAEREIYATHRLIDLYRGPLQDEGRALVELRRIAERFPESQVGASAREAIRRIKPRQIRE